MEQNTNNTALVAFANASSPTFYSSVKPETREEKAFVYNAVTNPEVKIADHINQIIDIKDIIVEPAEIVRENGEVQIVPRVILIDPNGHSFVSISIGIYNAVKRIVEFYGEPSYDEPVSVKVVQITKGANHIYSLTIV